MSINVSIVVPAYNEAAGMPRLLTPRLAMADREALSLSP